MGHESPQHCRGPNEFAEPPTQTDSAYSAGCLGNWSGVLLSGLPAFFRFRFVLSAPSVDTRCECQAQNRRACGGYRGYWIPGWPWAGLGCGRRVVALELAENRSGFTGCPSRELRPGSAVLEQLPDLLFVDLNFEIRQWGPLGFRNRVAFRIRRDAARPLVYVP